MLSLGFVTAGMLVHQGECLGVGEGDHLAPSPVDLAAPSKISIKLVVVWLSHAVAKELDPVPRIPFGRLVIVSDHLPERLVASVEGMDAGRILNSLHERSEYWLTPFRNRKYSGNNHYCTLNKLKYQ